MFKPSVCMLFCFSFTLLMGTGNDVMGQRFLQRRAVAQLQYTQPMVEYAQPMMQYAQPQVQYGQPLVIAQPQNACGCGCGSTGGCVDNPGSCDPSICGAGSAYKVTSKPVTVKPPSDCQGQIIKKSFYMPEQQQSQGTTKVPTKKKSSEENYRFEQKSYKVCGCTLDICVPCAIDTIEKEECAPEDKVVPMVARIRTSSANQSVKTADIWVYDITGLPDKAVLALNVTSVEANRRFGSSFSY